MEETPMARKTLHNDQVLAAFRPYFSPTTMVGRGILRARQKASTITPCAVDHLKAIWIGKGLRHRSLCLAKT
jgi:hypothetical protein